VVYARTQKNKTLTFLVSGALWKNGLVMQDRETDTMWSHVTGEAILGDLEGLTLDILPAAHTTWSRWKQKHPETEVLVKEKEFKESGYEEYFTDKEKTGLFRANWLTERMPGKTRVIGMHRGACR